VRVELEARLWVRLSVDAAVAERAGRIRRRRPSRLPDALIAATALEHRLTLVTRNVRDFYGIKGLRLRAPS
jgi:predicted nucleic acid-binding protein